MKIEKIEVRRLYTFGQFKNISFGYTAVIDDGEDVEKVKNTLLDQVDADWKQFIGSERRLEEINRAEQEEKWEIQRKTGEIEALQKRIDGMLEFLKQHGVDTTTYDLPF